MGRGLAVSTLKGGYTNEDLVPQGFSLLLQKGETISVAVQLDHQPAVDPALARAAGVTMGITYVPYTGQTVQKFIEIPYLDHWQLGPDYIPPNKAWYHAWDNTTPLQIRGFSVYFGTAYDEKTRTIPSRGICIYALDTSGNQVPGKSSCLPQQTYNSSTGSIAFPFQAADFTVDPGEYLSASCAVTGENASRGGDCDINVLVDVPATKVGQISSQPLYYDGGIANMSFLQGDYCKNDTQYLTPAGQSSLTSIEQTTLKPWSEQSTTTAEQACDELFVGSCDLNGQTIANGSATTTYQSLTVPSGSQCVAQTRTCTNGVLSGSYTNSSCIVQHTQAATPSVSITAPANNATLSGTQTITASSSETSGTIAGVQFQLDGKNLGAKDTTAPYSISWNTASSTNGAHTISAIAYDASGNTATSTVSVTVMNGTFSGVMLSKVDSNGKPFTVPGATISIRSSSSPSHYFPSVGSATSSGSQALAAGTYEIGAQVPDGYSAMYSICQDCTVHTPSSFVPYGNFNAQPLDVTIAAGQYVDLRWKFIPTQVPQLPIVFENPSASTDIPPADAQGDLAGLSQQLLCNVAGLPNAPTPTDTVNFNGASDVQVQVGILRNLGGIGASWTLINPAAPNSPLQLIDARSASGAAWQSTIGIVMTATSSSGVVSHPIAHFNQAAGNSAEMWGFGSPFVINAAAGISQGGWSPLYSNDIETGIGTGVLTQTSPCYHSGVRFGNGNEQIVPSYLPVTVGGKTKQVLQLTSTYVFKSIGAHAYTSGSGDEQALYFLRSATNAATGNLRVYWLGSDGKTVLGPVYAHDPYTLLPFSASAVTKVNCAADRKSFMFHKNASDKVCRARVECRRH